MVPMVPSERPDLSRYLPYSRRAGDNELDVWDALRLTDPGKAEGTVRLIYSGYDVPAGPRDGEYAAGWTREHVWPQSHGGLRTDRPGAGTDLHNIFPADGSLNACRNHRDFDACRGPGARPVVDASPAPGRDGATDCRVDGAAFAWEPPDADKGRVARACLYMARTYADEGLRLAEGATRAGGLALGRRSALLDWAARFPPTEDERDRNDVVEQLQGNRNPFVDDAELCKRNTWDAL